MSSRYRHRTYSRRLYRCEWGQDVLQRTAQAMYMLRRSQQSWFTPFEDLDDRATDSFFRWALEFLHAAMPDGPQSEVWYPEDAGKVYHRMCHEGCVYDGLEDQRWPDKGWWYEQCAQQIFDAGLHGVPVDNTKVLPTYLRDKVQNRLF